MPSRHFTTASGVQGMIDLTVPGGDPSLAVAKEEFVVGTDDRRDCGSIKRMLNVIKSTAIPQKKKVNRLMI